jgi:hypothetical protein
MKTIVEKWEDIGLLGEIDEAKKEELANCYEDAANFLMESHLVEDTYLMIETYIFPVLYNLVKKSNLILEPVKLIRELSEFLKRPEIQDIFDTVSLQFDGEAEALNLFIEEVKEKNQV